jgi:hypothetical protein
MWFGEWGRGYYYCAYKFHSKKEALEYARDIRPNRGEKLFFKEIPMGVIQFAETRFLHKSWAGEDGKLTIARDFAMKFLSKKEAMEYAFKEYPTFKPTFCKVKE